MIEVLRPGALSTVQDLGRAGLAHLGVGRSGAADRPALRLANRLVGNPEPSAALEVTLGGLRVRAGADLTVAVAGAPCPVLVDGAERPPYAPLEVPAGAVVELLAPVRGVRSYLAVRGGIAVAPVLGSRSTDTLAGLGPPVLAAGDALPAGAPGAAYPSVDVAPVPELPDVAVLPVVRGPRDDWFTAASVRGLAAATYEVSPDSDRVGVRLRGPAPERARAGELRSEGLVEGAVQVTPDGGLVLFLADHPVTGGYPVVGVVDPAGVALAAQARPGGAVRFRWSGGR